MRILPGFHSTIALHGFHVAEGLEKLDQHSTRWKEEPRVHLQRSETAPSFFQSTQQYGGVKQVESDHDDDDHHHTIQYREWMVHVKGRQSIMI